MELQKNFLRYFTFPILMSTGVGTFFWVQKNYIEMIPVVSLLLMIFVSIFLYYIEKIIPYRQDWVKKDGQELNDFGHALFGTLFGARLGRFLVSIMFPFLAASVSTWLGIKIWPTQLPLLVQIFFVFLIADFGRYWEHRLMHRVPVLWKFHALHHSADKLTILKTYRNHFIERSFQSILSFGPLVLLGVSPQLILFYSVPNIFLGLFSHSNADLRFGFLEYLINGPGAHRYHHSIDRQEGNTNFGSAIVVWDIFFKTYTCPVGKEGPISVGIKDDNMPKDWKTQFLSPFIWHKIQLQKNNIIRLSDEK